MLTEKTTFYNANLSKFSIQEAVAEDEPAPTPTKPEVEPDTKPDTPVQPEPTPGPDPFTEPDGDPVPPDTTCPTRK